MAEGIVWSHLRNRRLGGFKFLREHPVLDYRLDFYCHEARLAVEFDGEQHDSERDQVRDARISELGIEVFRIPNRSLFQLEPDDPPRDWLRLVLERCQARSGRDV